MTLLSWIIAFSLLGGVLSVLAAALFLLIAPRRQALVLPHMVSFAAGALLGTALLSLLPEALQAVDQGDIPLVTATVLGGILLFFVLEKVLVWRHGHDHDHDLNRGAEQVVAPGRAPRPAGTLILIGDGVHNLVDGILIGAAFLVDVSLGVATAVAVAAHEIPQELGDFVILLESGYSRAKALALNAATSFTTVIGALLAWFGLGDDSTILPYIIALAAASFIYIAVADLLPSLHRRTGPWVGRLQVPLIIAGMVVVSLARELLHSH